jgi:hypothetical protein
MQLMQVNAINYAFIAPLYFVWLRRVDFPLPWRWPPVALPLASR